MAEDVNVNAIADTLNHKVDLPDGKSQSDIDYVVAFQRPTAANNYTWYRKYKSGWVEMGQKTTTANALTTITMPIELTDVNYTLNITPHYMSSGGAAIITVSAITTTSFTVWGNQIGTTGYRAVPFSWQVSGIAAE